MNENPDTLYRLLVQSVINYAIYMIQLDGTINNWNAGAERVKGYLPDEVIGKNIAIFYSPAEQEKGTVAKNLMFAASNGGFETEGWRYRKDGSAFWAHVVIDAIYDDSGTPLGFTVITRDCTEQQVLLRQQREQEEKFRLLVEGVTDYAIYMLDVDGLVMSWNAGAQRTKGYTADEIVGKHFSTFYSLQERMAYIPEKNLQIAFRTGRFEDEGWRYRKDGSIFWAHVVIDAIYDDNGKLIGYAKITRDCSEQCELQRERRAGEEKFRLLVDSVTDYAIYMLDPGGHVVNWNTGAQRAKGYTTKEIIGQHFSLFYSAQERQNRTPDANLNIARKTGRFEDQGWRYRKDGSAFWAHVVIDAIKDDSGRLVGYAKITRDVTERREYEQQILRAKDLAEAQSERMTSMSRFLDTIITSIPSCVLVEDAVSREILLANRKAEQLFGVEKNSIHGKKPHECLPSELSDYFNALADTALRCEGIHQSERQLITNSGTRILHTRTAAVRGGDARMHYVILIVDDVTDQRAADARIHHMAHHDYLTSLPNRILFHQRLNDALRQDALYGRQTAALCLDLDHFKNVNDALGHQTGDELLRVIAKRLRAVLRKQHTLARLGGDEFAIVLPGLNHAQEASLIAQRLIDVVHPPVNLEGHNLSVGLSIGIAFADAELSSPEQLLRCADMALYEAKRNGRNRYEYFTLELDVLARRRRCMENDLREAITEKQLRLYYQPITNSDQKVIIGYEALMRWHHPSKGLIMPGEFIPLAEETGLIHCLGAWALYEACREAKNWPDGQTISVNLSPIQFKNSTLISVVEGALLESGLEPWRLEVEITESVLLDDTLGNIRMLQNLKALGILIALDDFGTGYSSLSYLRSFPFDKIKIDRSFINDMNDSREALAIIRAITGMSRSLDIQITAEGVESREQFDKLKEEGCTLFQGYFFGRPQPSELRLTVL